MTSGPPIIDEVETFVRQLAGELTGIRPRECLCCYTYRQLEQFGCDGTLRHALRYRDAVARCGPAACGSGPADADPCGRA